MKPQRNVSELFNETGLETNQLKENLQMKLYFPHSIYMKILFN